LTYRDGSTKVLLAGSTRRSQQLHLCLAARFERCTNRVLLWETFERHHRKARHFPTAVELFDVGVLRAPSELLPVMREILKIEAENLLTTGNGSLLVPATLHLENLVFAKEIAL